MEHSHTEFLKPKLPSGNQVDVERVRACDFSATSLSERSRPLIIEDIATGWPAAAWNLEQLGEKSGHRPVGVYGRAGVDNKFLKTMSFKDFVTHIAAGNHPRIFIKVASIIEKKVFGIRHHSEVVFPELAEDISVPNCINNERLASVNLWLGAGGEVTRLHFDPFEGLLTLLQGKKDVWMFAPSQTKYIYPRSVTGLAASSRVDLGDIDFEHFDAIRNAEYCYCRLRGGESLYIPAGYWHYVQSPDSTIAINFWWWPRSLLKLARLAFRPQQLRHAMSLAIRSLRSGSLSWQRETRWKKT